MIEPVILFQRSRWGPVAIICGFLGLMSIIYAITHLLQGNVGATFTNVAAAAFIGTVGWFFSDRRHKQGVVLAPRHLIVRDGTGETIEIHIEHARATLRGVAGSSSFAPMVRALELPDESMIPKQSVLVIEHGKESTELYCVKGLVPPKMRALRNHINASLVERRREFNYPEPMWAD